MLNSYNRKKLPYFFIFAKDKTKKQVEPPNNSCVNRIRSIVCNPRFDFNKKHLGTFNYKMLMSNPNTDINSQSAKQIIDTYTIEVKNIKAKKNKDDDKSNYWFLCKQLVNKLLRLCNNIEYITDVLVVHLFHNKTTKRKNVFWSCFGDVVVKNIERNLEGNTIMCKECGKRVSKEYPNQKFCSQSCRKINDRKLTKLRVQKYRKNKEM